MKSASEIENLITSFIANDLSENAKSELSIDSNLFSEFYLDSIGIMKLIAHIESSLELKIPSKDLVPRNFMTIQAMITYLETR